MLERPKQKNTRDIIYFSIFSVIFCLLAIAPSFVLWDTFPAKYFDDFFVVMGFPFLIYYLFSDKRKLYFTKSMLIYPAFVAAYWFFGWVGVFLYRFQPITVSVKDAYQSLKFFLGVGSGFLVFLGVEDYKYFYKKIWDLVRIFTGALFGLGIISLATGIFGRGNRYGLPITSVIYHNYTDTVAIAVFLACIFLRLYEYEKKKVIPWFAIISLIILFTLRAKGIVAIAMLLFLIFFVCNEVKLNRPMRIGFIVVCVLAGAFCLVQLYRNILVMDLDIARYALLYYGFILAYLYFPFGTGWGTFGCSASTTPYSPVYNLYGINKTWGLSEDFHDFAADTHWSMIMGQAGFIAVIAYAAALLLLFINVRKRLLKNRFAYASFLLAFLYMLEASTAEAIYTGYQGVGMMIWMGVLIAESFRKPHSDLSLKTPRIFRK